MKLRKHLLRMGDTSSAPPLPAPPLSDLFLLETWSQSSLKRMNIGKEWQRLNSSTNRSLLLLLFSSPSSPSVGEIEQKSSHDQIGNSSIGTH
jgi:hypothetical protein